MRYLFRVEGWRRRLVLGQFNAGTRNNITLLLYRYYYHCVILCRIYRRNIILFGFWSMCTKSLKVSSRAPQLRTWAGTLQHNILSNTGKMFIIIIVIIAVIVNSNRRCLRSKCWMSSYNNIIINIRADHYIRIQSNSIAGIARARRVPFEPVTYTKPTFILL